MLTTPLTFTPLYAAFLALLVIVLALRVVNFRRNEQVGFGYETGSRAMQCAVRAHANAVENIPLALVLFLLLELNGLQTWMLHTFGGLIVLARLMHAWGLSNSKNITFGRFYGTALTWITMLAMLLVNVMIVVTRD